MICHECGADKPPRRFYRDNSRPRGRVGRCKDCYQARQRIDQQRPGRIIATYRSNAKRRGIAWALTVEDVLAFWRRPCSYCGGLIETLGLDRIDNAAGYVPGNVVSCCRPCNAMKSNMTAAEFYGRCAAVTANAAIALKGAV